MEDVTNFAVCQECGNLAVYFNTGNWYCANHLPHPPEKFREPVENSKWALATDWVALLQRVERLEDENKKIIKALYGLGDILRDVNQFEHITKDRLVMLERIIEERTADS